jgi:UDP-N-acetyl-D-mannosaminuronate dehydrogenase
MCAIRIKRGINVDELRLSRTKVIADILKESPEKLQILYEILLKNSPEFLVDGTQTIDVLKITENSWRSNVLFFHSLTAITNF